MSIPLLTVTQLNTYVKSIIEGDPNLGNVFVVGEISNFTNHYRTGHYYMTLKDEGAAVKAVMFKTSNARLRFTPENGMSVVARGRVSVFERDGQYQLYIDDMQPDGIGALSLAFEQLKSRLAEEGLFDAARKKELPPYPGRIGVITSPTGAAVRDIITVLGRRFPLAEVVFCPVQVQGPAAAGQIAAAVGRFNRGRLADVIIVGRGGGSLEELWAFNEEIVARAVAASEIPVISAVGHETDYTICDFAADLRAPTPSAAAELAAPDWREQAAYLSGIRFVLEKALSDMITGGKTRLRLLSSSAGLTSHAVLFGNYRQMLDKYMDRLVRQADGCIAQGRSRLVLYGGKLDALSPLKVLSRGYAIASMDGAVVGSVEHISAGDRLAVRVSDGTLKCAVDEVERNV
ncbi:MAG: exodeoxyribonuclease VII large subunit [Oscillospiraceae bacterium]|nr:exodeoxyribonuclease VII large subunit [Oscillospiraceae bacterium]